jgi:hypothetical protein
MSNRFITDGKNAWQRLEDLLSFLDRSSLRRLNREEVRELGRIYRRTASDLAIARAESRDPRLINYLNSLVIRATGASTGPIHVVYSESFNSLRLNFHALYGVTGARLGWHFLFSSFSALLLLLAHGKMPTFRSWPACRLSFV